MPNEIAERPHALDRPAAAASSPRSRLAGTSMREPESLSQLIGDIYDAALEAARWPRALEGVCTYLRGVTAMLFWQDTALRIGGNFYSWGDDPHYTRLFFDEYIRLTPCMDFHHFAGVEEVKAFGDLFPLAQLRRSRFYTGWMQPQGYIDNLFVNLDKSLTSQAAIRVVRHERDGPIDLEMRRRMALIAPHIRRAVLIGKIIDLHKIEKEALTSTLDHLAAGVFLVGADGCLLYCNAAGQALMADRAVLRLSSSLLACVDRPANAALREVLAAAAGGDAAVGVKGIAIAMAARNGDPYVAHVLPLTSRARKAGGFVSSACAAVFVRKASLNTAAPAETLARLYDLTVGELRVLRATVEGGSVVGAARSLGLSLGTVKTHLHNLFRKTNTSRQVDLVKLVAAYLSPAE